MQIITIETTWFIGYLLSTLVGFIVGVNPFNDPRIELLERSINIEVKMNGSIYSLQSAECDLKINDELVFNISHQTMSPLKAICTHNMENEKGGKFYIVNDTNEGVSTIYLLANKTGIFISNKFQIQIRTGEIKNPKFSCLIKMLTKNTKEIIRTTSSNKVISWIVKIIHENEVMHGTLISASHIVTTKVIADNFDFIIMRHNFHYRDWLKYDKKEVIIKKAIHNLAIIQLKVPTYVGLFLRPICMNFNEVNNLKLGDKLILPTSDTTKTFEMKLVEKEKCKEGPLEGGACIECESDIDWQYGGYPLIRSHSSGKFIFGGLYLMRKCVKGRLIPIIDMTESKKWMTDVTGWLDNNPDCYDPNSEPCQKYAGEDSWDENLQIM